MHNLVRLYIYPSIRAGPTGQCDNPADMSYRPATPPAIPPALNLGMSTPLSPLPSPHPPPPFPIQTYLRIHISTLYKMADCPPPPSPTATGGMERSTSTRNDLEEDSDTVNSASSANLLHHCSTRILRPEGKIRKLKISLSLKISLGSLSFP